VASVVLLWLLPFSRVAFSTISEDDERLPPGAGTFALGPVVWDLETYRTSPALEPFRTLVRARCGEAPDDAWGLAPCVMTALADAFVQGDPSAEFLSPSFDPEATLERHLAGEPGHCVTRSGILATALLSTGTPARVVQWLEVG